LTQRRNERGTIVTTQVAAERRERALWAKKVPTRGWPGGAHILAVLILLILGSTIVLGLAACGPDQPSPEEAIVGEWTNPLGGVIHFYAGGSGFIPGDESLNPPIPSLNFTHHLQDETHISINMAGQDPVIIEIKLEGDEMTWIDRANNLEFVYTRAN
jgi:hypothetical protein